MSNVKKVKSSETKYDWIITSKNDNDEIVDHPVSKSQFDAFNNYVYAAMRNLVSPDFGNPRFRCRVPYEFSHHRSWDYCGTVREFVTQNLEPKPGEKCFQPLFECKLVLEYVEYIYPVRLIEDFNAMRIGLFKAEKIDLTRIDDGTVRRKHNKREEKRFQTARTTMRLNMTNKYIESVQNPDGTLKGDKASRRSAFERLYRLD
jgi:hypothetical protein